MNFYLLLFFLGSLFNNFIFWWSIFLFTSLGFFFYCSILVSQEGILNYFVVQESLGLLFLVMKSSGLQWMIIMMKMGVSPLIFWIFYLIENFSSKVLFWFLTFQKLPFLPIFINFFINFYLFFFFGVMIVYFLVSFTKKLKNLIFLNSTESFGWAMLLCLFNFSSFFFICIFYFISFYILLELQIFSLKSISLELSLFLMNAPFFPSFFVKFFSIGQGSGLIFLVSLLIFMVLSVLSFFFLFFVIFTKISFSEMYKFKNLILYYFFFFFVFFYFSKM